MRRVIITVIVGCFLSACTAAKQSQSTVTNSPQAESKPMNLKAAHHKKSQKNTFPKVNIVKQLPTNELDKNKVKLNMIATQGTIRYFDLEGGFYGIVTQQGQKLLPLNLSKAYQQDGAVVKVKGELQQGMMTIQQWGTPFKISHIEIVTLGKPNSSEM